MELIFPNVDPVPSGTGTLVFPADVDGVKLAAICEISEEALQDHFGATSSNVSELIAAFKGNRYAIEQVARRKYTAGTNRWLLKTADF